MTTMLQSWISTWKMDAPLRAFGTHTWATKDIYITVDAFGVPAAFVRGVFEYLYTATDLTLLPHLPDNVTVLDQKFPIRWGPYRLFISTVGVRSSGIASVTINGTAITPTSAKGHRFNGTALMLDYASMPTASKAAEAAVASDISTAADAIALHITFKSTAQRFVVGQVAQDSGASLPPDGAVLWLKADDLAAAPYNLKPGSNVTDWQSSGGGAAAGRCSACKPPTILDSSSNSSSNSSSESASPKYAVRFNDSSLCGNLVTGFDKTVVAAFRDTGSSKIFCGVYGDDNFHGLTVTASDCATGTPQGPGTCNASSKRTLSVDFSGSGVIGWRDLGRDDDRTEDAPVRVATVSYGQNHASRNLATASSFLGGCSELPGGHPVAVPFVAKPATSFRLGQRFDTYGRFFKGDVHELLVYNRSLSTAERQAAEAYLSNKWGVHALNCTARYCS
jgi:hypothetical protein